MTGNVSYLDGNITDTFLIPFSMDGTTGQPLRYQGDWLQQHHFSFFSLPLNLVSETLFLGEIPFLYFKNWLMQCFSNYESGPTWMSFSGASLFISMFYF